MWRQAAKVSYNQYTNEMAVLLRKCLKEPFRSQAMKSTGVQFREKWFANGAEVSRNDVKDFDEAFKSANPSSLSK
ncbi:hypothetical protein FOZ61_007222 [Perkinsus olseni]|uniref:ATP synthase subunit epsilon, mitochondrial n=1 Tax=Perkinsus olseni TaxID=32597 RepID=A0A7J6PAN1_PEROL|nr:hypothetical protein FOZ61_007222 [Perkinsus olseni]KAF4693112.1 hypothetical protein FOZ60_011896 [Perkinsus olseni]KAF4749365.1 hypothetical protein FOZ63_025852 [Perkinsus olseni]